MKNKLINEIIRIEGGYVNDKNDSGGETNYGITKPTAIENGYNGKMKDMPKSVAIDIYTKKYWDSIKGDSLLLLSEKIAAEVFDTAVNTGVSRAGKFLQRALNILNKKGMLYNDVNVDGKIGNKTISALKIYLSNRDEDTLNTALNCLQGSFYITLAERREKDERFIYGWLKNRVVA